LIINGKMTYDCINQQTFWKSVWPWKQSM
jgi:hypothetical protein